MITLITSISFGLLMLGAYLLGVRHGQSFSRNSEIPYLEGKRDGFRRYEALESQTIKPNASAK